jgi:hypothetical protein
MSSYAELYIKEDIQDKFSDELYKKFGDDYILDATKTFGVLGAIPFRRFEVPESTHSVKAGEVQYRPASPDRCGRGRYGR